MKIFILSLINNNKEILQHLNSDVLNFNIFINFQSLRLLIIKVKTYL